MRYGLPLRLAAAAFAATLGGCAGDPGGSLEQNLLAQTLTGNGIVPSEKPEIEYRPRSPLVLPSRYDLRTPQDPNQVEQQTAAWPKDPDLMRRRAKEAEASLPVDEYRRRMSIGEAGQRPLTPEELARGRREPAPESNVSNSAAGAGGRSWGVLLPSEYQGTKRPEEQAVAAGAEPPRRYLTEPPTGYRKPIVAKTPEGQKAAEEAVTPDRPWYKRMWPFGS